MIEEYEDQDVLDLMAELERCERELEAYRYEVDPHLGTEKCRRDYYSTRRKIQKRILEIRASMGDWESDQILQEFE